MEDVPIDVVISCPLGPYTVAPELIRDLAYKVLTRLGAAHYELSIQFGDSSLIRDLNHRYRNKDTSTDVLSFPQQEFPRPLCVAEGGKGPKQPSVIPEPLGDLVLSLEDAAKNARDIAQPLDREVCFLIVHGLLHLCGHDHMERDEEELMTQEQKKIMAFLAPEGQPPLWIGCAGSTEHE